MKDLIKKSVKFVTSRVFYVILGLFFALAIYTVQAVWSDTVSSGQTLTPALWNDIAAKLVELDNRSACGWTDWKCTYWQSGAYYRAHWAEPICSKICLRCENGVLTDISSGNKWAGGGGCAGPW